MTNNNVRRVGAVKEFLEKMKVTTATLSISGSQMSSSSRWETRHRNSYFYWLDSHRRKMPDS